MLRAKLIDDLDVAHGYRSEWDDLAVTCSRPFCSPGWMLSWWRHAAPREAHLRVIVVTDGPELVGIAPFFAESGPHGLNCYRLLASGTSARLEPLVRSGSQGTVSPVLATVLARADPPADMIAFDGIPATSRWPRLLCDSWPDRRRPWQHDAHPTGAPTVTVSGRTFDEWLQDKSANFRQEVRRRRRHLEQQGAVFRLAHTQEDIDTGLQCFASLHYSRWQSRGGSQVLNPSTESMLSTAGRELGSARFRLWSLEVDGRSISSHLFIAAGGELAYWLGGFEESYRSMSPSIQVLVQALRHAWSLGERRVDLGAGAQPYKYRLADNEDLLTWTTVVPHGPRYATARAGLAPAHFREAVGKRLPPEIKERLKAYLGPSSSTSR